MTESFSTDWLAQREPFDAAARAQADAALDWPSRAAYLRRGTRDGVLQVLDLGCGTGSNLRATALRLGGAQRWCLLDHDADLLAALPARVAAWAQAHGLASRHTGDAGVVEGPGLHITWRCRHADLAGDLAALPFEGMHLVTASALLDLMSAPLLAALVARCRAVGAAVHWALSVDDRLHWSPGSAGDEDDALVLAAFRAHQRRDKGLGPALGGAAVAQAAQALVAAGYVPMQVASDWTIVGPRGAADQAMLRALVDGIAGAAREQVPRDADRIGAWRARRLAALASTTLTLGHTELGAWLTPLS